MKSPESARGKIYGNINLLPEQKKIINILKAIERKDKIFRSLILQNQAFSKAILDTFTTDEKFANSTHKDAL